MGDRLVVSAARLLDLGIILKGNLFSASFFFFCFEMNKELLILAFKIKS